MGVFPEVVILVGLILANGVFAMAEIAIVSARKARLQQRAEEGDVGARQALALANEPTRFLSTIQIGITLIGTLTGVFGGATLAAEIAVPLRSVPGLASSADAISLVVVVVGIAYLSLVLGELAPKRLGLGNAERIAALLARPMTALARLTAPLVSLLSLSTGLVLRLLRVHPSQEPPVTEEEVRILIDTGRQAGVFEASEQELVENVFRLGDRRVSALVTPHTELVRLDADAPDQANWEKMAASPYDHFPVYRDHPDNVLGLVSVKALWNEMVAGRQPVLTEQLEEPIFVPESAPALQVLNRLRRTGIQVALVLDEYGAIMGLVTLFDLLEALVGEIAEVGQDTPDIAQRADGSWLVDGLLPVDAFEDYFDVPIQPEEEKDYQTVGGFVMQRLGRVPAEGDSFDWHGLRFEVVDMDQLRVDKLLVSRAADSPAEPGV